MKKALLAALTFIVVGFMLASGTFADDFSKALTDVFQDLSTLLGEELGTPMPGTGVVNVALASIDNGPQQLYPGGRVERVTFVENHGTRDAYFRLAYAFQYEAESWDKLTITFNADGYDQTDWIVIHISGVPYLMKVFTYRGTLEAMAESTPVTMTIRMHESITSEQISRYRDDFLQMQVLAIEAFPYEDDAYGNPLTPQAALDLALPLNNFNPF